MKFLGFTALLAAALSGAALAVPTGETGRRALLETYTPPSDLAEIPVLGLDVDGTLRPPIRPGVPANTPEEVLLLPYTESQLLEFQKRGYLLALLTNQAGVGKFATLESVERTLFKVVELYRAKGVHLHWMDFAEGYDQDRKPGIGMFKRLEAELLRRYGKGIDRARSLMVGDSGWAKAQKNTPAEIRLDGRPGFSSSSADRKFAEAAGIPFVEAAVFFGWKARFGFDAFDSLQDLKLFYLLHRDPPPPPHPLLAQTKLTFAVSPDELATAGVNTYDGLIRYLSERAAKNPELHRRQVLQEFTPPADGRLKVAIFDINRTLRAFQYPAGGGRKMLLLPFVASNLRSLVDKGYLLVGFSNSSGTPTKRSFEATDASMYELMKLLLKNGVKFHYYDFAGSVSFRDQKPNTGMMDRLLESLRARWGKHVTIDRSHSFMVGDSIREDLSFARTVGIPLKPPHLFFGWNAHGISWEPGMRELVALWERNPEGVADLSLHCADLLEEEE